MNDALMPIRLSTKQILSDVGISRQTLYKWIKAGMVSVSKDDKGHYLWDSQSVANLEHYAYNEVRKKRSRQTSTRPGNGLITCDITNRRYLGSKTRLLPFISEVVNTNTRNIINVADIFAGTGAVASMFRDSGANITVNDILTSNYIVYNCFFGSKPFRLNAILGWLMQMNTIKGEQGYVTENYGGRYFSEQNAMKIDAAREFIEKQDYQNSREKDILLTSLVYALDKVANTVGHYDAYRKTMDSFEPIRFPLPNVLTTAATSSAQIYCEDANELVRKLKHQDLIYIDTPYNSRQYGDTYHVLENIVTWEKPKLYGVARKAMDRSATRSIYCTSQADEAFDDLIQHLDTHYILVSYNNMAHKGNNRSNAKISNDEIVHSLSKRGQVQIYSTPFQVFTTGKTRLKDHQELLYLVDTEKQ